MADQEISQKNVFGYFIQDKKYESLSFVSNGESYGEDKKISVEPDMNIVASCNQGILCCVKKLKGGGYRYYVGKPSTRQWQAIPNPKIFYDDEPSIIKGMMVLPSSGDYLRFAIVRLTFLGCQENRYGYHCEIFDSKYWEWLQHENVILGTPEFIVNSPGVSSWSSAVHWLTSEGNVLDLQFDGKSNDFKFQRIRNIWGEGTNKNKYLKLVECYVDYEDVKFGFIVITGEGLLELWQVIVGTSGALSSPMKIWSLEIRKNIINHEDQVKYPCDRGYYNVDYLEDLKEFREILCYEKLLDDSSAITVRLDQLNVAVDVFRVRLDFEPINLRPRPTLSDDAKKSKTLRRKKRNKRRQLRMKEWVPISLNHSFASLVFILLYFVLFQPVHSLA